MDEPAFITDNKDGTFTVNYSPTKPGRYILNVTYGRKPIQKSPFTVNIGPQATGPHAQIKAFGPGLERGVAGKPATFTVEMNGAIGQLGKF